MKRWFDVHLEFSLRRVHSRSKNDVKSFMFASENLKSQLNFMRKKEILRPSMNDDSDRAGNYGAYVWWIAFNLSAMKSRVGAINSNFRQSIWCLEASSHADVSRCMPKNKSTHLMAFCRLIDYENVDSLSREIGWIGFHGNLRLWCANNKNRFMIWWKFNVSQANKAPALFLRLDVHPTETDSIRREVTAQKEANGSWRVTRSFSIALSSLSCCLRLSLGF